MGKPKILKGPFYFTRHATPGAPVARAAFPEMFRAATFAREEVNVEQRIIPVTFATETPVPRWFGFERLICTPQACNLQRLQRLGAFLSEHDRERQIGVVVENSAAFTGNRAARAQLRFSSNNPLAEQEWKDVQDGIRGLFSVGYVVHTMILRESSDAGETYDATEWEPLEISLVSIPADTNCTIDGRSESEFTFPVSIHSETPRATTMIRTNRFFSRFLLPPDDGGNLGGAGGSGNGGGAPPAATPGGEQNRGGTPGNGNAPGNGGGGAGSEIEAERVRVRELAAIGLRFGCGDEMTRLINIGGTVEAAYRYVADNGLRQVTAPGNGGGAPQNAGNPGGGNRPLLTAGDNGGGGQRAGLTSTIGQMLVATEQFRTLATAAGTPDRRAGFNFPVTSFRATLTTAAVPAGQVAIERLPGIQLLEQERLTIADLLGSGVTTSTKITYMQEQAYVNAAAMVAEGALKPEATFTFTEAEAPVRKCAVTAKISDEMLADYAYVATYVDGRLRFMIGEREEAQLLYGNGVSPNITGLMVTPGTLTQAKGDDSIADAIHKAMTKARVQGKAEPTGVVLHPNDWERIALAKDANGQYLAGGPFYAPYGNGQFVAVNRIWGIPVVATTAMTEGSGLVGAFRSQAQLFRREGVTVETTNSNEDDFKKNLVAIRAEERFALCVYRPSAFVKLTGLAA